MPISILVITIIRKGFMREAIKALQEAARINPEAADTHNYLGLSYHQTNQFEEAIAEFRAALDLEPDDPDYHYNLAIQAMTVVIIRLRRLNGLKL